MNIDALRTKYSALASGVYREFVDTTAEPQSEANNSVVVVGQFAKGPIMFPTLVQNDRQLDSIFGARDKVLEAQGCYSHIVAKHLLEAGPIYILNIRNIDQFKETLQVQTLAACDGEVGELRDELIADVYDTGKFWRVDKMFGQHGHGASLVFAAVLQHPVSVSIEAYPHKDFMYTVAETKRLNPSFSNDSIDDNALVSDYLVKVTVSKQIAKDKVAPFATYFGAIGDVIDKNGSNLNIVHRINADMLRHGLYAAINQDALAGHKVDLYGFHAIADKDSVTVQRLADTRTVTKQAVTVYADSKDRSVAYVIGDSAIEAGSTFYNGEALLKVISKSQLMAQPADDSIAETDFGTKKCPVDPTTGLPLPIRDGVSRYPSTLQAKAGQPAEFNERNQLLWYRTEKQTAAGEQSFQLSYGNNQSDEAWPKNFVFTVSKAGGAPQQVTVTMADETAATTGHEQLISKLESDLQTAVRIASGINSLEVNAVSFATEASSVSLGFTLKATEQVGEVSLSIEHNNDTKPVAMRSSDNLVSSPVANSGTELTVAGFDIRLEVSAVNKAECVTLYGMSTPMYKLMLSDELSFKASSAETSKSITVNGAKTNVTTGDLDMLNSTVTESRKLVIKGIANLDKHYVDGTVARQRELLDKLLDDGIVASFADPTIFRCRYMIDSFKTYIEPNAKHQFAKLASKSNRFLVIGNSPFYHELRGSRNPDFRDIEGRFQMKFVKLGANPDKPSTNSFSWPTGEEASFYIPYMNIMYNDGYSSKVVPASGVIGKLYYAKLLSATKKPFDIVAGPDFIVSAAGLVGPEFDTNSSERAIMEQLGTNVLQTINGKLQVRSNVTAYQYVKSAFNTPDTVEKCLFISDYVEPALSSRLFKMNNADARLAVKQKADTGCDLMLAAGVISAYVNKCDLENNNVDVRKAGIIVLDTELYNEYGVRIAVHRTTVKDPEK